MVIPKLFLSEFCKKTKFLSIHNINCRRLREEELLLALYLISSSEISEQTGLTVSLS